MASKCRKFVPNIFNKTKCQTCFGAKEIHSAEALENNKASRKVSKCGYLFVAPLDFDFNNPLDRSRRWQRRFFVLYDDAELTYSVDDNVNTIPQEIIDMNKCNDVIDAEKQTSHLYALGVITPEKTIYIKGESKEESQWWYDVLIQYPRSLKSIKPRRKPPLSNKENVQPTQSSRFEVEKVKGKADLPTFSTYRGVRSLKHKYDKTIQDGLRKSSSLHDLSSEDKELSGDLLTTKYLSCSGDHLNYIRQTEQDYQLNSRQQILKDAKYSNPYFTIPRTLWHHSGRLSTGSVLTQAPYPSTIATSVKVPPSVRPTPDDSKRSKSVSALERTRIQRERSSSLKDFPTSLSLPRDNQSDSLRNVISGLDNSHIETPRDDDTESNETDELKMARSCELNSAVGRTNPPSLPSSTVDHPNTLYEDLVYMKKGWLIKLGKTEREPKKHWFVLAGNSLHYYKDAKAEDSNNIDGRIDLSTCYEVSEVNLPRNYGLKIKTRNGEYQLAAMTSGIRNNWMKALRLCMDLHSGQKSKYTSASLANKPLAGLTGRASDDINVTGTSGNTQAITNPSGETAFQLVGSRRETKNTRRHHSDVNPGNVSKVLSVSEFSGALDAANLNLSSSTVSNESTERNSSSRTSSISDGGDDEHSRSKKSRHHGSTSSQDSLSWSQSSGPIRRFVEGSDSRPSSTSSMDAQRRPGEKEDDRRDKLRRGKSPSARIKEKSRSSKAPRLHSPPPVEDYSTYSLPPQNTSDEDINDDMYHDAMETTDGTGGNTKDGMLVELLETEVESLKESLDHKEEELVKMQEANIDLKNRLQTADSQSSIDRWNSNKQIETSQLHGMKKQVKESKDALQRQKNEIDSLKSRLDMSTSKLTGTEKALAEALKELKQEKERFLKLSNEWNRRIRTVESQLKESTFKLDRSKENLTTKDRECRRLETEVKGALQKSREYEREILKLKAVEHEYRVLKEKIDEKEHTIASLQDQVRSREAQCKKLESELEDLEKSNSNEQDALENHIEELQTKLVAAHQKQSSMTDSLTSNMADMFEEKNRVIAQMEEKLSEKDRKISDMTEELQAEMSENAELINNVDILQDEKQELVQKIERLQTVQQKLDKIESENTSLKKIIEQLKSDGTQVTDSKEKDKLHQTIYDLNQQVQELQLQLIDKFEDIDRSTGSKSPLDSQELLHTVLQVDSELKDVNAMLLTLRQKFDAYLSTQQGDHLSRLISLADMIEDIGRKCISIQDVLREVPPSPPMSPTSLQGAEYSHEITINAKSSTKDIISEYKCLKNKFDSAVTELKSVRKEVKNVYTNYDKLEQEDSLVKSQLVNMEKAYKSQLESMMSRVETLTSKLDQVKNPGQVTPSKTKVVKPNLDLFQMSQEVEKLLDDLDNKFVEVEKNIKDGTTTKKGGTTSSRMSVAPDEIISQLKQMKAQLDHTNVKLKDISQDLTPQKSGKPDRTSGEKLQKRLSQYGQKIDTITSNLEKVNSGSADNLASATNGLTEKEQELAFDDCLSEIRGRIIEIGEQLDAIDDDSSESESEDDEETTIDDVREKLSQLMEFVEKHSKLSSFDWKVLDKMTKQHSSILKAKQTQQEPVSQDDRLKLFSDRVSLEAVILGEMASLLQNKYKDNYNPNPLFREIHGLNNVILSLHQMLDMEMRHFNVGECQQDVLTSYADILAERIILESESAASENPERAQITILAMESLTRSQIDSQINEMLDKPISELEGVSSHIVSRALIQGELTHALQKVKKQVENSAGDSSSATNKQYAFHEMKSRETTVLDFCRRYEEKMIEALSLIIARQGDDLPMDQGPVSVLEAVCSEISTIIEKHIQTYKQKIRTANDTHTANKYDQIVTRLRGDREKVLISIKDSHKQFCNWLADDKDIDDPDLMFQSLDSTINNFGEILSMKSVIVAVSGYVKEMYEAKDLSVYETEESDSESLSSSNEVDRGVKYFLRNLSELLEKEALNKQDIVLEVQKLGKSDPDQTYSKIIITLPDLNHYPPHLCPYAENLVREAVFQAQLTYVTLKMRLEHEQELAQHKKNHTKIHRDDSQESEIDFHGALAPLEDVLDSKFDDESDVLQMFKQQVEALRQAFTSHESPELEEEMQQLEHMLEQELLAVTDRHEVQLEVYKQELSKIERMWNSRECIRDEYRERIDDLEDELNHIKYEHEEEVEQMKQDVLTAVGAIRANEELSETNLTEKVQNLIHQVTSQKRNYKMFLEGLKRKLQSMDKSDIMKKLDEQLMTLKRSASNDEDGYSMTSSTSESDLSHTDAVDGGEGVKVIEHRTKVKHEKSRKSELDKLRKEKEDALAEEMRNTKAALDAMRKAYEGELQEEKEKFREALTNMYTEEYLVEIRRQHDQELTKCKDELKHMELHYQSKSEDYKILEVKMKQIKQDYDGHIKQLLTSNEQLNRLAHEEVENIKEFIKRGPSRLAPGSSTIEEELYDSQIMVRVKDAELQKLRLQVKNHENSIHRMTEEQRQTMTENLRLIKENQEVTAELKKYETMATKPGKLVDDNPKKPVRRAPSFHQRARSPSPESTTKKEGEHQSREGNRRRHLAPKDLKRSKSSPSLPYVFDATKAIQEAKTTREVKTPRSVKAASSAKR